MVVGAYNQPTNIKDPGRMELKGKGLISLFWLLIAVQATSAQSSSQLTRTISTDSQTSREAGPSTPVPLWVPLYKQSDNLTAAFLSTKGTQENPTTAWRVYNAETTLTLDEGSNGAVYQGHVPVLQNEGMVSCSFEEFGSNAVCIISDGSATPTEAIGTSTLAVTPTSEGDGGAVLTVADKDLLATAIVTGYPQGYDTHLIPTPTLFGDVAGEQDEQSSSRRSSRLSGTQCIGLAFTFGIAALSVR